MKEFTPKLLASEQLTGGWLGIAMEYIPSACHLAESPRLLELGQAWMKEMDRIVDELHSSGFVHGDLRLPNFLVDGERLLLIDFDWGGKEGQARFPDIELAPILRADRDDVIIRKDHDRKVLADSKRELEEEIARRRTE